MSKTPLASAFALLTALALLPAMSNAEVISTTPELASNKKTAAYIYSRPMVEAMYKLGVEQDKKFGLQPDCRSEYRVEPVSISVLAPIDFPEGKPHPVKGVWNFRYQLQRCGESKLYNALFFAAADGAAPTPRAYYPGATNANPLLVKDAMVSAVAGALLQAGLKDCKDVFDMRVTQAMHDVKDGGSVLKGVWNETWTFKTCGQMSEVAITFIPDATGGGTTFKMELKKR